VPGRFSELPFPGDVAVVPWHASVDAPGPVTVCRLGRPA